MKSKKIVKTIFKIFGILVGLIIVLAIVLPLIFKKQIIQAVKTEINKSLIATVDFKDYHLSLFRNFPNFTLGLDNLTVVGQKDFEKDTLANIEKLKVTIGLFSVIKGDQYTIKRIAIESPKIQLKVLKGGKANWDISKPSTEKPKPGETEKPSAFKLSIQKLSISNAKVIYDDEDANMHARVINLNHTLSGDLTADLTNLSTETKIDTLSFSYGGISYLSKANFSLDADFEADLKNSKYTFKDNELQLNNLFLGFDGWVAMPKEDINMDLTFKTKKTDFKNLLSLIPAVYSKDFDKVETKGSLALDGFAKGTYNDNTLPAFAVTLLVDNAMFKYPSLPKAVTNINLNVKVSNATGKPDATVINIKKLHLEMGSNPADIVMLVSTPVSDPNIDGTIKVKVNLAEVKDFYPLEAAEQLNGLLKADVCLKGRLSSIQKEKYEEFQAKGEIAVSKMSYKSKDIKQGVFINELKLMFSPKFVDLPLCDIKIGKSDIQAKGHLDNLLFYIFKNDKLSGNFTSTSRLLDLNEFMSDEAAPAAKTTETTPATSGSVIEVPANIDFVLNSSFGRILYDNMDMSQVQGIIKIADRKLTLEKFKMNMLEGTMVATGYYSTQKTLPQVDFTLDISQFDIPKTFKTFVTVQKLAPIAEKCTGKVSIKMNLNTAFDKTMAVDFNSLNAGGSLTATNVEVKGFEAVNKIADALKIDKFKKLGFDKANVEFHIANGRLTVKPYSFTFEKIKMTVSGYNSLDQTMNYDVVCEIPRELFGGAANGVLNNLVGQANKKGLNIQPGNTIIVAIKVGGTISKPIITTNIKNSVKDAVEDLKEQVIETVKDKVNETVDKAKEEASKEAQKLIADAEAKAQQLKDEAKKAGDALVAEAEKQGKALEDQATNPFTKAAAKESHKQLVKTAKDKSDKLQQEAAVKADKLIADAKVQADKLKK